MEEPGLDPAVKAAVEEIHRFKRFLEHQKSTTKSLSKKTLFHINLWLAIIDDLLVKAKAARGVICVIGSTGAGKSSVVNAFLNEE